MQAFDYELNDLTRDEFDDTAQVDWVRVYDATSVTPAPPVVAGRPRSGHDCACRRDVDGPRGSPRYRLRS